MLRPTRCGTSYRRCVPACHGRPVHSRNAFASSSRLPESLLTSSPVFLSEQRNKLHAIHQRIRMIGILEGTAAELHHAGVVALKSRIREMGRDSRISSPRIVVRANPTHYSF